MASPNHFYNPFLDSFLGIWVPTKSDDRNFESGMILKDIDLYFQPVPDPITATIFLVIMMTLNCIGSYITIKVLSSLKNEESLLKNMTQNFMISQLILWPLILCVVSITNFTHSFPSEIVQWICPIAWFVIYLCLNLTISHSCFTAIMRYFFIVHNERVKVIGKKKVKKYFDVLSILVPLLLTLWKANDGSELDALSMFNKCYGKHHQTFLVETSTLNVFKKNFCNMPNYRNMNGYVEVIVAITKNILCLTSTCTILLFGSNLTEGIIYYLLFSHMNK